MEVLFLVPKVTEDKLRSEGKTVPEPIKVKALVDTGASNCAVDKSIPTNLNLSPVDITTIKTASSKQHSCYRYYLRMVIPLLNNYTYEDVFNALDFDEQGCLIGRDFLQGGILVYVGYMNQFTLSF